jgi:hypothetical protein
MGRERIYDGPRKGLRFVKLYNALNVERTAFFGALDIEDSSYQVNARMFLLPIR